MKYLAVIKVFLITSMLSLLIACDSSEWLEVPGDAGAGCNETAIESTSGRGNPTATAYCAGISKEPTGKSRCENGRLQIQCK